MNMQTRLDYLAQIARMYYIGDMTQEEISENQSISRSKVARLLKAAKDSGLVKITVATPSTYYVQMAEKIRVHFGLKHVHIVPSEETNPLSKQAVTKVAARYIGGLLHDDAVVGITWGSTVSYIPEFIPPSNYSGVSVWALNANLSLKEPRFNSYTIITALAEKLNAQKHTIEAPNVVQSVQLYDLLMSEPAIYNHFKMFKKMDIAIIGMGSYVPEENPSYLVGEISLEEARQLCDSGYSANITGRHLFADGTPASTMDRRVMSIPLEVLKIIPDVVAVAVGKNKTVSIAAAAKGGYYNALFIDEEAAIHLIKQESIS